MGVSASNMRGCHIGGSTIARDDTSYSHTSWQTAYAREQWLPDAHEAISSTT